MSRRNSIGRLLAARFHTVPGSSSRIVGPGIAFIALGVIWLMGEASTEATCVAPLTLGGLLLAGAAVAKRSAKEPCNCLVEVRPVRVHPPRQR
jgi:ABC-type Co2+ transport system permease subunit